MGLLFVLRVLLHLSGQEQPLSQPPAHNRLGPNLVYLIIKIKMRPHEFLSFLYTYVYGPEPAVASTVTQKRRCISRAKEYAAARNVFDVPPIGGSEPVCTKAEELLDAGNIGLPECVKLADFYKPYTL